MKEERIKQLMNGFGMPDSISLMTLIEQVVNETEQEVLKKHGIDVWNTKQSCNETEEIIETCNCNSGKYCKNKQKEPTIAYSILPELPIFEESDDTP